MKAERMDGERSTTEADVEQSSAHSLPGFSYFGKQKHTQTLYYSAAVVLAALIPLLLFAGLWAKTDLDKSREAFDAFTKAENNDLSQKIDNQIHQQISVLQAIASLPCLDEPNLKTFHETALRMMEPMPQWVLLSLIDPESGQQLVNTLRPLGSELPKTTAPALVRRVAADRAPGLQTRYRNQGGVFNTQDAIFIYVPVIRDGQVRSVLTAGMKAREIQTIVTQRRPTGLANLIVDENGRIVGSSDDYQQLLGQDATVAPILAAMANTNSAHALSIGRHISPLTGWTILSLPDGSVSPERPTWTLIATGALSLTLAGILAIFLLHNILQKRVGDERLAASRTLTDLNSKLLTTTREALAEQQKAASEREVLMREIYHRVKNNLQIVQSLLRLGSRDLTAEQREPFEMAVRRIGAMAQIHTLLYNSPDLASVDFKEYLERILSELALGFGADYRRISTTLDAQSMRIPLDTAIPLAFIVVEIVTNAYKHAFPNGHEGVIDVRSFLEGDQGVLIISDNGIGFPAVRANKRSMGLNLISKLSGQIGGELTAPMPGESEYRLVFPLNDRKYTESSESQPA